MRTLTSNTPSPAIPLVDESNQGTGNNSRETAAGVEKTNLRGSREIQVLVPGVEGLKTSDDGAVICKEGQDCQLMLLKGCGDRYIHPFRIMPTKMTLKKL